MYILSEVDHGSLFGLDSLLFWQISIIIWELPYFLAKKYAWGSVCTSLNESWNHSFLCFSFLFKENDFRNQIWSLGLHNYWNVIVLMAAQHIELENRYVCAHVFVFIFITVCLWSLSMYSDIITSGKEYPQFYTNHLAFWLEISDFCTGLPSSVLLERPNSYESESVSGSVVWLFAILWTAAYQVPLSMKFSRQECWSGLPFPSPGELPDPGIKPRSPALQAESSPSEPPGKP